MSQTNFIQPSLRVHICNFSTQEEESGGPEFKTSMGKKKSKTQFQIFKMTEGN